MKSIVLLNIIKDKKKQNFVIYGVGQAFNLVSPLLVIPYIVSVCGENGLGKVTSGFAMALFLILIVDYAFEVKGPKEVSENRDNIKNLHAIANTTFFSKIILFIPVFCFVCLAVFFVPSLNTEKKLFLYSLTIVLAQVFNPSWFLQGVENFKAISIINICSKLSYIISIYMFINNKQDYMLVNFLLGLSTFIFNVSGIIYVVNKYEIKIQFPAPSNLLAILKADFSFCVSQLFLSARQLAPVLIISTYLGFYGTGQYRIIETITNMFRTLIQVYNRFFYPSLCYKISKDPESGFNYWKKYSLTSLICVIITVVLLIILSEDILRYFNASAQTISAIATPFKIALTIPVLMALMLPLEQLMFVANKDKVYIKITIFITTIAIISMLIGIKLLGILGIVFGIAFSELLCSVLFFNYSFLFLKKQTQKAG